MAKQWHGIGQKQNGQRAMVGALGRRIEKLTVRDMLFPIDAKGASCRKNSEMTEFVRSAALTGYLETMGSFGVDPHRLLNEQGLSIDQLANPEQFLPAHATIALLERSAEVTGCITLGLRMAEGRSLANLGASSLLIAHQSTLRKALSALSEFRTRINSTLALSFEEIDGEVILREDFSLQRPRPLRQSSNLALGVLARICDAVLGKGWAPRTVVFSHEPPPPEDLPIFTRIFHCRPEFNHEFNAIILPSSYLDQANPHADDQLADHARRLLASEPDNASRTTVQVIDQLVRLLLPTGRATIEVCARSLGVTVRTLQRRLDDEGASFSDLLNRAKMQLAMQYLENPRMRITDIADMLGYGSIGAFTRWCTNTFGMAPLTMRRKNRALRGF